MTVSWKDPPPGELSLDRGQLHIWRIHLDCSPDDSTTLSDHELARSNRFFSELLRRRYRASHHALRDILSRYERTSPARLGIVHKNGQKPHLFTGPNRQSVCFNLTRSENLCLVAVARHGDVGIDLESISSGKYEAGVAERVFTTAELSALAAAPGGESLPLFLRGWARKEAYAKYTGLGLALDLRQIEIGLADDSTAKLNFAVSDFVPEHGYIAAWAALEALIPHFWNWKASNPNSV